MNHGPSRFRRRAGSLLAGVVLLVPILAVGFSNGAQAAETQAQTDQNDPAFWPVDSTDDNPDIDSTAHSIRYAGQVRDTTNFATALAFVGNTEYPYGTSDRNGDSGASLNETDDWWGAGACPEGVIITARDRFADSLTAATLSQPGDQHGGPSATNLNGGSNDTHIDMEAAPTIITSSGDGVGRDDSHGLSASASKAARYMENNTGEGCAENAIIIGGHAAVPTEVEGELATIGYDNVYRIAGINQFDTAKQYAFAQGTGPAGPLNTDNSCTESDARDGLSGNFFHGNAAPEFWTDATHCKILPRTVLLADGGTGADALMVGWFTSFYGIPVVLTNPDGSIPPETKSALQTLPIENMIVAGGTGRISDPNKDLAAGFAGLDASHVYRVAGNNRSLTSIEFAMHLGGWFPQGDTSFTGDMFCVAASSGEGLASRGWPDDLGAGPLCGDLGGDADDPGAPTRLLPPANGGDSNPYNTDNDTPAHDWVPIFLTGAGGALDSDVSDFLESVFPPSPTGSRPWCDSNEASKCDDPGFGIAFGGTGVVSEAAFHSMATLASGGKYTNFGDLAPTADPFFTKLDLDAVYDGAGGGRQICANRGALTDVQFLTTYDDPALHNFDTEYDIATGGDYDVNGVSTPVCLTFTGDADGVSSFLADSLSGHFTTPAAVDYSDPNSWSMTAALASGTQTQHDGADSHLDGVAQEGLSTHEQFTLTTSGSVVVKGTTCSYGASGTAVDFTITRGASASVPDTFTATFTLVTASCGTFTVTAQGEAKFISPDWSLRGSSSTSGGTGATTISGAIGGFTLDLATSNNSDLTDDSVSNVGADGILGFGP